MIPSLCKAVKDISDSESRLEALSNKVCLREAVRLVRRYDERGFLISFAPLYCILEGCIKKEDLQTGRQAHALIVQCGFQFEPYLNRLLIRMYAVCGSLGEANRVFRQLREPSIFSWTEIICMNVKLGQNEQAIKLYEQMQWSNVIQDGHTYVAGLRCCMAAKSVETGKLIHSQIVENDIKSDSFVQNTLIEMHAKLGMLEDAQYLFNRFSTCDVVMYSVMIGGYLDHSQPIQAIQVFSQMQQRGLKCDRVIIMGLLKAVSSIDALQEGRVLHVLALVNGLESEISVSNSLIDMYVKCGSMEDAKGVFDRLQNQDLVTVNVMISGFVQCGQNEVALHLYCELLCEGFIPSHVTILTMLKLCSSGEYLHQGKCVHFNIIEFDLCSNIFVINGLIEMYAKCSQMQDARSVFCSLREYNVVSWNMLIAGHAQQGEGEEAAQIFKRMLHVGIEHNITTFVNILRGCSVAKDLLQGKIVHCYIRENDAVYDSVVMNSVMDMYMNCQCFTHAFLVFDRMPRKDITTWNIMIARCIDHGHHMKISQLLQQMLREGFAPDEFTCGCMLKIESTVGAVQKGALVHFIVVVSNHEQNVIITNNLIDMYSKCGCLEDAYNVFIQLCEVDIVTWNVMIEGSILNGLYERACQFFKQMQQEGMLPDRATLISQLKAASGMTALQQGKLIHIQIIETACACDMLVGNSLLDMYGKCGSLEGACAVFHRLPQQDGVAWCSMIVQCAKHNNFNMAMHYFEEMQHQGIKPTNATLSALLSSFTHAGRLDGFHQLKSMLANLFGHALSLDQCNYVVDLFGRVGQLDDAFNYLRIIPFKSNMVGWTSLLTNCKIHGNLDLARLCFDYLYDVCAESAAGYVLLSDVYSDAGLVDNADELEELRMSASIWKTPGKALIEVNNSVHEFIGGNVHCLVADVCAKLKRLSFEIKNEGCMPL